jgi:TonB-linked SusC/RagA family outer membrane protein
VKFNSVKVVLLTFYYDFWHWLIQINYNMKTKFNGILTLLLAFVVQLSFAQEKTISGTVVDETNMPLPGATVLIKGTTTGTSTDFDGNYSISANSGDVLTFSYVGYADQDATIAASNSINISLVPDNTLEEVVVTALGIKRKPDELTTANKVVKAEVLTQANNPDVIVGLAGKVSGLQINKTSNGVSSGTRITLRGTRSLTGNNEALVVIDGVISTASFLKNLDPNTIETINVIKGANGAALYGSDGANGALIVTTKKGGSGEAKFSVAVSSSVDFESIAYLPQRQTRYGQGWSNGDAGYVNYTYENGGWGPEFDGAPTTIGLPQADGSFVTRPYTSLGNDNIKPFFQTGYTTQNGVAISFGDADGYVNIGAKKQETSFVIEGDELQRTQFNFKAGKTLGKLSIGGNATYISTKSSEASSGLYGDLLQVATNIPVEAFENSGNEGHWNGYFFNPYWIRDNNRRNNNNERFNLIADLKYDINDNINVVLRPSLRFTTSNQLNHDAAYADPQSVQDISGFERTQVSMFQRDNRDYRNFYTDLLMNFDYMLTDDVSFKANIGANNRYNTYKRIYVGGENLTIPGLYTAGNLSGGPSDDMTGDFTSSTRQYSVYGQIDLGYKDFLFVNATARNDWTSVLSQDNNSYFYPSVGLSFIPTKAFDNIKGDTLNYLKILASYVKVGNDGGIGAYRINNTLSQATGFPYGGINSYVLSTTNVDPNLTPEFTNSFEVGMNVGLFKNRVTLDASYYKGDTTDQILSVDPSLTSGLTSATINVGDTTFDGFDIDLGVTAVKTENLTWDLGLTYATSKTVVKRIAGGLDELSVASYGNGTGVYAIVGEEFPMIKATAYERDDLGRVVVDGNGNPKLITGTKQMGTSTPDYILGLNTSIKYKNLTLAGTFDYRTGHVFHSDLKSDLTWSGHLYESGYSRGAFVFPNSSYESSPGVYTENTTLTAANTPSQLTEFYSTYVTAVDENEILDATALKIREVSLKYDFSPKVLKSLSLSSASLGVNARNLFTWLPKENRGYANPESNFSTGNAVGLSDSGQYPETRTYGFSLNLTF